MTLASIPQTFLVRCRGSPDQNAHIERSSSATTSVIGAVDVKSFRAAGTAEQESEEKKRRAKGTLSSVGGAAFPRRPPVVRDRAKQTVNYPDNTGEGGKRPVNETLIRSRFESFGSVVPSSELKDCCSVRVPGPVIAGRRRSHDTRRSRKPLLQGNYTFFCSASSLDV